MSVQRNVPRVVVSEALPVRFKSPPVSELNAFVDNVIEVCFLVFRDLRFSDAHISHRRRSAELSRVKTFPEFSGHFYSVAVIEINDLIRIGIVRGLDSGFSGSYAVSMRADDVNSVIDKPQGLHFLLVGIKRPVVAFTFYSSEEEVVLRRSEAGVARRNKMLRIYRFDLFRDVFVKFSKLQKRITGSASLTDIRSQIALVVDLPHEHGFSVFISRYEFFEIIIKHLP